ncbi:hypothetical protein ACVBEF_07820 [Glaciimonas sp. GG7]
MSLFTLASSTEIVLFDQPILQAIATIASAMIWPVLGLGVATVIGIIFKPLLRGMWRAALALIKPHKSLERRIAENKMKGRKLARRMANDHARSHPNLAAELRLLAGSN